MDKEFLDDTFNDIEEKLDFLIELCLTLQIENGELISKVDTLTSELNQKKRE
ncbi:MAG: hypothetical protein U9P10_05815 [Thermodesulfobacteriota bacterium]|nr:hypothetical protein [Thermodesulfobacteriota bacterium]